MYQKNICNHLAWSQHYEAVGDTLTDMLHNQVGFKPKSYISLTLIGRWFCA